MVELPAVETELPKDRSAIQEALARLGDYGWLVFTSPSGAEVFFELMGEMKTDIRALAGVKLAVIGRATGEMFVETRNLSGTTCPDSIMRRIWERACRR